MTGGERRTKSGILIYKATYKFDAHSHRETTANQNSNYKSDLTDEQIELFVRLLAEMKQLSKEKLNSDFYFTFYPQQYGHWPRIKAELEKQQIKYLDLSNVNFAKPLGTNTSF